MMHIHAKRLQDDERQLRTALKWALLQYGTLLGFVIILCVLGFAVAYYQR